MRRRVPIPAKLAAPALGNVVRRSRLFRQLDAARRKPVVWVSAPAGAGKTTLAATYLAARGIKPLWYQIDARDADPATFFAYLREAVGRLAPRRRELLPLLSPDYALGLSVFVRNFFEQAFARLRRPAVLVFDNFQDLPETAPLQQLLPEALTQVPSGVAVVFLSRSAPPPTFAALQAHRMIAHLNPAALALTLPEMSAIARRHGSRRLSANAIRKLHARTHGWVAGFTLALEHVRRMPVGDVDIPQETRETLFDYFASEVFERSDASERRFLVATAVLPQVTAEMAQRLTDNLSAGAVLARLVNRNYFTTRLAGGTPRYQYHPLFREFLLARGPAVTGDEWPQLRRRAAELLAESDLAEDAVAELAELGEWDALVPVIVRLAPPLAAAGRFATLRGWIERIPLSRRANPWLTYWLGQCHMVGDYAAARHCFEEAFVSFREAREADGMLRAWTGVIDTILNALNDIRELDVWIDTLDRILDETGKPPPALVVQVAPRMFAALVLCRPQHPRFRWWRDAVVSAFESERDPSLKLLAGFYLFTTAVWARDFAMAEEFLARLRKIGDAPAALPTSRILRELSETWYEWLRGRAPQALRAVETALGIAEQTGVHLWDGLLLIEGAVSAHTGGDQELAGRFLAKLEPVLPHLRLWDRAYYYHESAWHLALAGDATGAQRLQKTAVHLVTEMGGLFPEAEIRVGMAQAWSLSGDRAERDREHAEARRIAGLLRSPLMGFMTAFTGACYALEDGDADHAAALTAEAMRTGRIQGYGNFSWWLPSQAARLCGFALQRNIEPAYVRELIRLRGLMPPDDAIMPPTWPFPLKVRTFGPFSLQRDDKPVRPDNRRQKKTLALLKALIAFGGQDVAEERLCQALWPEAEGDLAHQNFKVALHRLRKLVLPEAFVVRDGKVSLDPRHVWVDARAFEQLLDTLETVASEHDTIRLAGEAITLYRGAFLQGDDDPWLLTTRERLRDKFLRVIGGAGERLCEQGFPDQAIRCYQKAIETDSLAERFYQGLMDCHYRLRQPAEGLAIYRRCRDVLRRELGVNPSEKTELLHAKLREQAV